METTKELPNYTELLAQVIPRKNGTKEGIKALQASLDRNKGGVK